MTMHQTTSARAHAADAGLKAWLYRPYIDLGAGGADGNIHVQGTIFAKRALLERKPYPRIHGLINPSFRRAVVREARLPAYTVADPLQLPEELRTEGWRALCHALENFSAIEPEERVTALWLLHRMCLHGAILHHAPNPPDQDVRRSEAYASIAYMRGLAHFAFANDGAAELDTSELERVAKLAPPGSWAQTEATYHLAAAAAKLRYDPQRLRHWSAEHRRSIDAAHADEHTFNKLMSRFHRMYAFVPQFERDWAGMTAEMDLAEAYAEKMNGDTPETRLERMTLGLAICESRTKELLVLRDLDRAESWARRAVERCPHDPRGWLELGQVLIERDKVEEALAAYREAVRFGPPGTEIAWFMAGQCCEALDDPEQAADAYLAALDVDPLAISAAQRLAELAPGLDPIIGQWAQARVQDLQIMEAASLKPRSEDVRPYQHYEGVLGSGQAQR